MVPKQSYVIKGILPANVTTQVEVVEVRRELEALEEFMHQAELRKSGTGLQLPKTGRLLEEFVRLNNLNLLHKTDRATLISLLNELKKHAPTVHVSFASDPSPAFLAKFVAWFRQNVHPQTLLQVGLQPTLAAGCTIRTTNKVFDFSLRNSFIKNRQVLIDKLKESAA